jgi:hypothetical protein
MVSGCSGSDRGEVGMMRSLLAAALASALVLLPLTARAEAPLDVTVRFGGIVPRDRDWGLATRSFDVALSRRFGRYGALELAIGTSRFDGPRVDVFLDPGGVMVRLPAPDLRIGHLTAAVLLGRRLGFVEPYAAFAAGAYVTDFEGSWVEGLRRAPSAMTLSRYGHADFPPRGLGTELGLGTRFHLDRGFLVVDARYRFATAKVDSYELELNGVRIEAGAGYRF